MLGVTDGSEHGREGAGAMLLSIIELESADVIAGDKDDNVQVEEWGGIQVRWKYCEHD